MSQLNVSQSLETVRAYLQDRVKPSSEEVFAAVLGLLPRYAPVTVPQTARLGSEVGREVAWSATRIAATALVQISEPALYIFQVLGLEARLAEMARMLNATYALSNFALPESDVEDVHDRLANLRSAVTGKEAVRRKPSSSGQSVPESVRTSLVSYIKSWEEGFRSPLDLMRRVDLAEELLDALYTKSPASPLDIPRLRARLEVDASMERPARTERDPRSGARELCRLLDRWIGSPG